MTTESDPSPPPSQIGVGHESSDDIPTLLSESEQGDSDQTGKTSPSSQGDPDSPIPFVIGNRIAQGAMGAILEADDCKLGRKIAVKVMLDEAASETTRMRFVQEAVVLGKLEHPNIVPVHDLGRDSDGQLYYSMKLVKGRTLQDIINDLRAEDPEALQDYTLDRLLTIFQKICDALAFAHSEQIIHRDLKPENIMVGKFGEVLVMDWGLSKILGDDQDTPVSSLSDQLDPESASASVSATLEGSIMGTPQYMSPEQAAGEISEMDPRSDVYSLGGILYAILTLQPPVQGTNVYEILDSVRSGNLTPPSLYCSTVVEGNASPTGEVVDATRVKPLPHSKNGKVPAALSAVAMKALSLVKEDRYQRVSDLEQDIEKWQGGFATSAEEAGLGKQLALLIRRNRTVFSLAAAAWVIISGLAAWFVINLQAKEQRAVAGEAAARTAEAVAVEERETARKLLTESSINLAESAMKEGNGALMEKALSRVPVQNRNSTWDYLTLESNPTAWEYSERLLASVVAHPILPSVFLCSGIHGSIQKIDVRSRSMSPVIELNHPSQKIIAISPDGEFVAAGPERGDTAGITIYRSRDGRILNNIEAPASYALAFSEDSTRLLQTSSEGADFPEISLWDTNSGELIWRSQLQAKKDKVRARFLPGNRLVFATVRNAHTAYLLDTKDGSVTSSFEFPRVEQLDLSADGSKAIYVKQGGGFGGFDLNKREIVFEVESAELEFNREQLAFFRDGNTFLRSAEIGDGRQVIEERSFSTGTRNRYYLSRASSVRKITVHPYSGDIFALGVNSAAWRVPPPPGWTLEKAPRRESGFWGKNDYLLHHFPNSTASLIRLNSKGSTEPLKKFRLHFDISSHSNAALLKSHLWDKPVELVKLNGAAVESIKSFPTKDSTWSARLSWNEKSIALYPRVGPIGIYSAASGKLLTELQMPDYWAIKKVHSFAWLKGDNRIIGIRTDGGDRSTPGSKEIISLWDTSTGEEVKQVTNPTAMDALAISPTTRRFAEGGLDRRIRIRDTVTLQVLKEFRSHNGPVKVLAWHPTQPIIASASDDLTVRLWNVDSGESLETLPVLDSHPVSIQFSQTGLKLLVSDKNTTRIWNLRSDVDPRLALESIPKN